MSVLYKITGIFLFILLFFSCAHRYVLTEENKWEFYYNLNDELGGRKAKITFLDGEELSTLQAEAYSESGDEFITFIHRETNQESELPVEMIKSIEVKNRATGGIQGFLLGLAGGFLIGAVAGLAEGKDPPCDENSTCVRYSGGLKAIYYGTLLGVGGGLGGALVGAIKGSNTSFEFYDVIQTGTYNDKKNLIIEENQDIIE